jgi:cysteinyl-tRNA synthetase
MNKDIFLTNNLSNNKEKFVPLNEKKIGMYVCGPTVYDNPHIGNARPLVIFDILFKVLKCKYGKNSVTYVRNITDVDDKIINSSKENNIPINDLTEKIIKIFTEDCDFLNCEKPSQQPKATEHIELMIKMISKLIDKGFAYENKKHVYFQVNKFKDYGKLSNKKLEDLIAGSRVEVSENKKSPEDFVLWKPSIDKEPFWDSPWGKGRPGWHLECSAMSKKFLGDKFDIHGGGIDLLFPHHENEIAQSRCANDTKVFANYWIHNAFITMSNEKMSKSQGNILKISDFKKKMSGQVLRLALMTAHYRQPLDWNDKLLDDCKNTLEKWYEVYIKLDTKIKIPDEMLLPLYEDLNTPGYITNLHKLYEKASKGRDEDKKIFVSACNFIGLLNQTKEAWLDFKKQKSLISEEDIIEKITLRNKARDDKKYKEADKIRDELLDKGVLIEDKDGKTTWKLK